MVQGSRCSDLTSIKKTVVNTAHLSIPPKKAAREVCQSLAATSKKSENPDQMRLGKVENSSKIWSSKIENIEIEKLG